ncbi:POLX protein, partial [Pseudoatta argentina]
MDYAKEYLDTSGIKIPFLLSKTIIAPPRSEFTLRQSRKSRNKNWISRIKIANGIYLGDTIVEIVSGKAYLSVISTLDEKVEVQVPTLRFKPVDELFDNYKLNIKTQNDRTEITDMQIDFRYPNHQEGNELMFYSECFALPLDFALQKKISLAKLKFDDMWKQSQHPKNIDKYPNLTKFLNAVRSLPYSIADAERMLSFLTDLKTKKRNDDTRDVTLADKEGKKLTSNGKGEIVIKQNLNNDRIRLKNVLCVPDININLLSVAKITDHGYKVEFNKYGAIVYRNKDEIKMTAVRKENAYYVKSSVIKNEKAARTSEIDIWHKRFGHTNKKIIEEMKKEDLVIGLKETDKMISQCESCVEGKMCRKAHPRLTHRKTKKIMELWHIDLVGPINPSSYGGKRYIFTIIDDYSRVIFIDFLKEKKEASEKLKKLILLKENQTGMKLKGIRSDNGGEFVGKDLEEWFSQKGIKHELSPAKTPQCNGVVERANKSIIEMTRTMMTDSKMPLVFWAEAACTAVHIKNRSKTTVHGKTPYEIWNGRRPNVKYMRRFGCVAYLLNKDTRRKKFDPRVIKGIFLDMQQTIHAVVGDSSDNENENITTENKDIETEIQPMEKKNKGRPQGTTKAMIEARKQQTRDEQREEGEYRNLRRSERIKGQQMALITMDNEVPKNIQEAKQSSNWVHWKRAMFEELKSMEKHEV